MLLTALFASRSKINISPALLFFQSAAHTRAFAEMRLVFLLPDAQAVFSIRQLLGLLEVKTDPHYLLDKRGAAGTAGVLGLLWRVR